MGTFTKGDIVLYPYPYTDLSKRKIRPCLVLSKEMNEDIILCQITSRAIRKDTYAIELKQKETEGGNLAIDSFIRSNMVFTAAKRDIKMRICKVSDKKYNQVTEMLLKIVKK
tara:strand:- start:190 stop:525 length:336 start_codon:yes stop_codon:yes gene_type:complete